MTKNEYYMSRIKKLAGCKGAKEEFEKRVLTEDYFTTSATEEIKSKKIIIESAPIQKKKELPIPLIPATKTVKKVVPQTDPLNEEINNFYETENNKYFNYKKDMKPMMDNPDKVPDFIKRAADIARVAKQKVPEKKTYAKQGSEVITEAMMQPPMQSPAMQQPTMATPEATPQSVTPDQQHMQGMQPETTKDVSQKEPEKTPEPEQTPQEPTEEKKGVSKNQLVANVVKAVEKLVTYIDWTQEPEEKVKNLAKKVVDKIEEKEVKKNNLSALTILLACTARLTDEKLKNLIISNFAKHIANNEGIKTFAQNIIDGKMEEMPVEMPNTEPEEEAPTEEPKQEAKPEATPVSEPKPEMTTQPEQTPASPPQENLSI